GESFLSPERRAGTAADDVTEASLTCLLFATAILRYSECWTVIPLSSGPAAGLRSRPSTARSAAAPQLRSLPEVRSRRSLSAWSRRHRARPRAARRGRG